MSKHDDAVSINGMLSHALEAVELLGDSTRDDLQHDRVMQLALTRLVEIIGEAANRVSPATQHKQPALPWPQIKNGIEVPAGAFGLE
ncbi:MAG: HepT-like ribonuclease domain-containing protein [Pirellulales bacterium]